MKIQSSMTNINHINQNKTHAQKTLEKIASAKALDMTNSASRIIANSLNSQANALTQGIMNANESIGVLQIADGALQNVSKSATKLQELSVRYNNDALGSESKRALEQEFQNTARSITETLDKTTYAGKPIFGNDYHFETSQGSIGLSIQDIQSTEELEIGDIDAIQKVHSQISQTVSDVGSATMFASTSINNMLATSANLRRANSNIADADMAELSSKLNADNLKLNTAVVVQAHDTQRLQVQMSKLLA